MFEVLVAPPCSASRHVILTGLRHRSARELNWPGKSQPVISTTVLYIKQGSVMNCTSMFVLGQPLSSNHGNGHRLHFHRHLPLQKGPRPLPCLGIRKGLHASRSGMLDADVKAWASRGNSCNSLQPSGKAWRKDCVEGTQTMCKWQFHQTNLVL